MSHQTSTTTANPPLVTTRDEVRRCVVKARAAGKSIGLVPTMGALHEGHLSLVRACASECDFTVVTIFVNPAQFGPSEDFKQYPRTFQTDLESLAGYDVDLIFAPAEDEMYQPGHSTYVTPPKVAEPFEGRCRAGHFLGVATVVLKLFHMTGPDVAYFGQKDYQQSLVIRRMVEDLDLPVRIELCPTVRETDGLAMSSRNPYLNQHERRQATALWRSLCLAAERVAQGERKAGIILAEMGRVLADAAMTKIDYIALVDPETLRDIDPIDGPAIALLAAYVGQTRLIDNHHIG